MIKRTMLALATLALCAAAEAQCIAECCAPWCDISLAISAVKPGGINSLPVIVRENTEDSDGWEGRLRTFEFDWSPAWEVNFSRCLCDGGRLGLQYWGTYADNCYSVNGDSDLYMIFASGENDTDDLDKVEAHTRLNGTKIALNYTDWLTCGRCVNIEWSAGLNFYYFHSRVEGKGFEDGDLDHFTENKDTNYLIGPTTGLSFTYCWNQCFDLYMNNNLTLAYNHHCIERKEGPFEDIDSPMDFHYSFGTVVPVLESALGVSFTKCCWDISLEYGFKWFNHLFDSVQQIDDTNEGSGLATPFDVTFHGFTLRVGRLF